MMKQLALSMALVAAASSTWGIENSRVLKRAFLAGALSLSLFVADATQPNIVLGRDYPDGVETWLTDQISRMLQRPAARWLQV